MLEDIEDFIILKGFTHNNQGLNSEAIQERIRKDLAQKREREAMAIATAPDRNEEDKKEEDVFEEGKIED